MQHSYNHPGRFTVDRPALTGTAHPALSITCQREGVWFIDFGKAMFGTVRFTATCQQTDRIIKVNLGEKLTAPQTLDTNPPGTIRYACVDVALKQGTHTYTVKLPDDQRNTGPAAILMPSDIGQVLPFRYCQIQGVGFALDEHSVEQIAAHIPFDDDASHFESSDPILNAVWELCKHTIKATTFCGVYVDGDRERIPYEGDAYINQLSHYSADFRSAWQIARYSHELLIQYPTWFADWNLHSVFMAWADYHYTGQTASITCFYEDLKAKTLIELAREDGLICTELDYRPDGLHDRLHLFGERYLETYGLRDLVDWPPGSFMNGEVGERDNHEMMPINTVVNALHYQACALMSRMAMALGFTDDAALFEQHAHKVRDTFNDKLFDAERGVYIDGEGSTHSSLHSNIFPLAFGMVPTDRIKRVATFIKSRGMACSVYAAQYLLESLYEAGEATHALNLMTATHDRGWYHMIEQGSTMTLEAWALKYKSNLDWNHAWATAPLNIITRKLMGIEPVLPGFSAISFNPQPATLEHASLKLPTPLGRIDVSCHKDTTGTRRFELSVPKGMTVQMSDAVKVQTRLSQT